MILNKLGLTFELDSSNFTAKIITLLSAKDDILIPRCVNYQNNDYVITSISKFSFKGQKQIKSICFSEDSGLLLIEKKAFYRSSINHLSLPASIEKLEEGWCHSTPKLVTISVSTKNPRFSYINNKFLVGKTNENSDKFDILLFARRDIKQEATIPSSIKVISKYSFCDCKSLKSIKFDEKTEIQKISKSSFFNSSIEKVQIPSTMKEIEEGWCKKANKLKSIHSNHQNFLFIQNLLLFRQPDQFDILLFASRDVKQASIPQNVRRICSYAFSECKNLKVIDFNSSSELESIGKKAFVNTSFQEVKIPSSVCIIEESSFMHCKMLKSVIFPINSKLTSINENAFNSSAIESISFPSNLVEIKNSAFHSCVRLKSIEFDKNSKLEIIDDYAFTLNSCSTICIPSSVVKIGDGSFSNCYELVSIEFQNDSNLKIIGKNSFKRTSLKNIVIPSSVKEIGEGAFSDCWSLESIQFDDESEIEVIEEKIFFESTIQSFSIPSKVKLLKEGWCSEATKLTNIIISPHNDHFKYIDDKFLFGKTDEKSDIFDILLFARRDIEHAFIPSFTKKIDSFAFSSCKNLKSVKFASDSNLISIGNNAFNSSTVESIFIPSSVVQIEESAFKCCHNLQRIDNYENSQIRSIEKETFTWSALSNISLPPTVEELKEGWCYGTAELVNCFVQPNNSHFTIFNDHFLLGKLDPKSDIFDVIHFCNRDIKHVMIPSTIRKIDYFAFGACVHLKSIEFEEKSQLASIEEGAFSATQIGQISVPPNVQKIGEFAFGQCKRLRSVNFDENSMLRTIEKAAFQDSSIVCITLPQKVKFVGEMAFENCPNLCSIEFLGDDVTLGNCCLNNTASFLVISFPNAFQVRYLNKSLNNQKGDVLIYVPSQSVIF